MDEYLGRTRVARGLHALILLQRRRLGLADTLIVLVVWAVLSGPWLTGHRFTTGDNIGFYFPMTDFVVTSLLRGDPPWWNPLTYGGQPLLGDPQSMVFSPHTFVGLLAGHAFNLHVFDLTTLACLLFGGLATRALGARYTDRRAFPLLGAVIFMAGGVAASRLQHVAEIVSYSLIPVQMLAMRKLCLEQSGKSAVLLGLAILPALLSPNQVVFLSAFTLGPFFALFLTESARPVRAVAIAACAACAALLIAAPVLACFREVLSISNRPALPIEASSAFSFPLFNLTGFLLPALYGITRFDRGLWPPTDCSEDYIYLGVVPCLILAWILVRPLRTSNPSRLAALLTVLWCIFSLGTNGFLYPVLFSHVPGMSGFRRPADAAFLFNASISIAVATATIGRAPRQTRWIETAASVCVFLVLAAAGVVAARQMAEFAHVRGHVQDLAWSYEQLGIRAAIIAGAAVCVWALPRAQRRSAASILAIILTVFDVALAGRFSPLFVLRYKQSAEAQFYGWPGRGARKPQILAEVLAYLRRNEGETRRQTRIEALGGALAANLPMAAGFAMTQGYNPLTLASYSRVVGSQSLQGEGKSFTASATDFGSDIYRRLSLRYVLIPTYTLADASTPGGRANIPLREALSGGKSAALRATIGEYEIWELAGWLPKATLSSDRPSAGDGCRVLKYRNDFIRVACTAKAPATLIVGDNFAPGWSACVNQTPVAISAYRGLFREVPVEAGQSIVTMRYQPVPFLRFASCG